MNAKEFEELLSKEQLNACEEAKEWAKGKTLKEVWNTCDNGSWMLWLIDKMQDKKGWYTLQQITLAKAKCAKLAIHLVHKNRKDFAEITERYGLRKPPPIEEMSNDDIISYGNTAPYGESSKFLKQFADICRRELPIPN